MRALVFVSLLFAIGCPGLPEDDDDAAGNCEYTLEDPCMTADNLEQCEDASAQCPGMVMVMESCPLQFGCP